MIRDLLIEPRDPAMFRDGRPFSAGLGAKSMGWPMPSTVAGHVRTRLWQPRSFERHQFGENEKKQLLAVRQTGPFLACETEKGEWELGFPAPADAAIYGRASSLQIVPLRPETNAPACDLPDEMHALRGARAEKATNDAPPFWTASETLRWLKSRDTKTWIRPADQLGYEALPEQSRIHVKIRYGSRNAEEGMLFRTVSREFDFSSGFHKAGMGEPRGKKRERLRAAVYTRVEGGDFDWGPTSGAGAIGGERRIARWSETACLLPEKPAEPPEEGLLRVQLVTPGLFDGGWKPGWTTTGEPPGCPGLKLELVAAAVRRYEAVSGFDMAAEGAKRLRATRFVAPAGSVYFFRITEGDVRQLWLKSISDLEQDRRDGFGIVLTGGWQWL